MENEALSEASVMKGNCYMENGYIYEWDVFSQNDFYIFQLHPLRIGIQIQMCNILALFG